MEKYIFIHENPQSTAGVNSVVAMIGTMELLDYNVELVSDIPAFRTYLFDDAATTSGGSYTNGSININLLLSTALQVDKVDTAKKFMTSFQRSFEQLSASIGPVVDFYPPPGIVMGTVSG